MLALLAAAATTPAPIVNVSTGNDGWVAPAVVASILASIVALVIALFQPWWRDRRDRTKRPRLSLHSPDVVLEKTDVYYEALDQTFSEIVPWARVSIRNDGKRTAQAATVFVLYWSVVGSRRTVELRAPLRITHESDVDVTVHPGMPRLVDVAWMLSTSKDATTAEVFLVVAAESLARRHVIKLPAHQESRFEVHLRVVAEGADPADYRAEFWTSGSWNPSTSTDPTKSFRFESLTPLP